MLTRLRCLAGWAERPPLPLSSLPLPVVLDPARPLACLSSSVAPQLRRPCSACCHSLFPSSSSVEERESSSPSFSPSRACSLSRTVSQEEHVAVHEGFGRHECARRVSKSESAVSVCGRWYRAKRRGRRTRGCVRARRRGARGGRGLQRGTQGAQRGRKTKGDCCGDGGEEQRGRREGKREGRGRGGGGPTAPSAHCLPFSTTSATLPSAMACRALSSASIRPASTCLGGAGAPHFFLSLGTTYRSDLTGPAERMPLSDWLKVGRPTICDRPAGEERSSQRRARERERREKSEREGRTLVHDGLELVVCTSRLTLCSARSGASCASCSLARSMAPSRFHLRS